MVEKPLSPPSGQAMNSARAGNLVRRSRERIQTWQGINSREQGIDSVFSTGVGNLSRDRLSSPTHPIASRVAPYPSPADVAEGRLVRAGASIVSRGSDGLEPSVATFPPAPWSRRAALTGAEAGPLAFGASLRAFAARCAFHKWRYAKQNSLTAGV